MSFSFRSKVVTGGLIFLLSLRAFACFNGYHFDYAGRKEGWKGNIPVFFSDHDTSAAKAFLKEYEPAKVDQYDFTYQSDIALRLAYLGDYKRSLTILIRLQKAHPKEYNIASNLGTIYELTGNNEQALIFIKKGRALNNKSHEGSEWVHEKILEAKIAMKGNPTWINSHHVLEGNIDATKKLSSSEKREHIVYQLKERIPFTPFPDPILADIFNTLGDLYAADAVNDAAYICYELSAQNNGRVKFNLDEKRQTRARMIRKSGEPVPDWDIFYQSYYDNEYGIFAKDELAKAIKNPALTEKNIVDRYNQVSDFFVKKEEPKINYLPAVAVATVMFGILLIYFRRKKGRVKS